MIKISAVPSQLLWAGALLLAVVGLSTVAYVAVEGWSWFDSLYMTIATLTTVGGGEPAPLDRAGRWLTLFVIVIGVGVMTYTLFAIVAYLLEGHLGNVVTRRRNLRAVAKMENHFIICGYGRVGREIALDFGAADVPFVIIDVKQESVAKASANGYRTVDGNASDIEVLKAAGIARARGLVTAVDSDADNIFVALSARVLRPDLFIVARANNPDSQAKLKLAGANRIISPYTIGGRRMANLAMRPTAVEFVDSILSAGTSELLLEDLTIDEHSYYFGKHLQDLVSDSSDVIVLAIKRGETMLFRPDVRTRFEKGDELVVAGSRSSVTELERNAVRPAEASRAT